MSVFTIAVMMTQLEDTALYEPLNLNIPAGLMIIRVNFDPRSC